MVASAGALPVATAWELPAAWTSLALGLAVVASSGALPVATAGELPAAWISLELAVVLSVATAESPEVVPVVVLGGGGAGPSFVAWPRPV